MRSPRIAERAMDLMKSRNIPLPVASANEDSKSDADKRSASKGKASEDPVLRYSPRSVELLQRNLKIERKGRSLLVDIMYTDTSAKRAAGIANAFMDGYIADQLSVKSDATHANSRLLKERVDELRDELLAAERKIQKYKADKDIVEIGDVTLTQKEIGDHEQELAKARARAAEAEARLSQVNSMANQVERDSAKDQVKLLESGLDTLKQKLQRSQEEFLKLNELRRDAAALKTIYLTLLNRYREAQAQENAVSSDAQIVNYAVPPADASFPKKKLMLAAALLGSLILGSAGILLRELAHPTIYSAADVERAFGLQPVAVIPLVPELESGLRNHKGETAADRFSPSSGYDGTFERAIFSVRKWIGSTSTSKNNVVVIASEDDGDGRSTIAAQLAAGAARAGRKALLIDADLRNPGLTRAFGDRTANGLCQVAGGDFSDIVVRRGDALPDFCAAGSIDTGSPLDILSSPAVGKFIEAARSKYDLTVIDTAAMGQHVDAGALIDMADVVLVVVKSGRTAQSAAEDLMRQISTISPKPFGAILNMAQPKARGTFRASKIAASRSMWSALMRSWRLAEKKPKPSGRT
jgi:succinoglycan biosynthesis transport protein ExoP